MHLWSGPSMRHGASGRTLSCRCPLASRQARASAPTEQCASADRGGRDRTSRSLVSVDRSVSYFTIEPSDYSSRARPRGGVTSVSRRLASTSHRSLRRRVRVCWRDLRAYASVASVARARSRCRGRPRRRGAMGYSRLRPSASMSLRLSVRVLSAARASLAAVLAASEPS